MKGSFSVGVDCAWGCPGWAMRLCVDAHLLDRRLVGAAD